MSMRIEGTLAKWNNERGFGFISPDQGGPDVFVHASAFPQDGVRPVPGARLSFEIDVDRGGRKRAVSVLRLKRAVTRVETRAVPRKRKSRHGRLQWWVLVAIVAGLAYYAYGSYVRFQVQHTVVAEPVVSTPPPPPERAASVPAVEALSYRCDGRTRCSEMTSCAEATYFLRHCPGVEMDGDGDGVPCEQQWCAEGAAR
ncbi:cold shock domain-containing protein [Zoogloea sp.]|uniref:cold shock domain-containing protein n=1 Tax=Zoogloea sp. TaxID=49181 RepID=UPI0035B08957